MVWVVEIDVELIIKDRLCFFKVYAMRDKILRCLSLIPLKFHAHSGADSSARVISYLSETASVFPISPLRDWNGRLETIPSIRVWK